MAAVAVVGGFREQSSSSISVPFPECAARGGCTAICLFGPRLHPISDDDGEKFSAAITSTALVCSRGAPRGVRHVKALTKGGKQ